MSDIRGLLCRKPKDRIKNKVKKFVHESHMLSE